HEGVDVSVAVATPGGLITPIVRGADAKSVAAIGEEVRELAARARENKLRPEEFQGGAFSVSNLGMFGVDAFFAIVNPPQSAILAVGASRQVAVVKDGRIAAESVLDVSLSVDQRVYDADVVRDFMAAFKQAIEDPLGLLV
ncbi:2--oxoacid dehydrogenases acyltransferase, partial [Helicosporidium sp. ATCC 50920]